MDLYDYFPEEPPRRAFSDLVASILRDVAPGEVDAFEASDGSFVAPGENSPVDHGGRTRGLPEMVEIGMVCLHLLTGTLAVIEGYRRRKERMERHEAEHALTQVWQEALIETGMSSDLARLIPVKFSPDMMRFLVRYRLRDKESGESAGASPGQRIH